MTVANEEIIQGRRYFYMGNPYVIYHLLSIRALKPVPGLQAYRRKGTSTGHFIVSRTKRLTDVELLKIPSEKRDEPDEYKIEILHGGMSGFYVFLEDKTPVGPVYDVFYRAVKHLASKQETREIIKPILPTKITDMIAETIFDFYQSIDDLGTTKGFGNVGIILAGPPGVGKTETMRWVGEYCRENFNRGSFLLSLIELQKMLANGVPFNTDKALIFVDDIDANILRDREETGNQLTSQFLTCLDGLDKCEGRVMMVSTNEKIDKIDPALTRPGRFDHIIHFDYPSLQLIQEFLDDRKIEMDAARFEDWSFARIDQFMSKFRVANHRFDTPLDVYYEKFIHDMGQEDQTVEKYHQAKEIHWDE